MCGHRAAGDVRHDRTHRQASRAAFRVTEFRNMAQVDGRATNVCYVWRPARERVTGQQSSGLVLSLWRTSSLVAPFGCVALNVAIGALPGRTGNLLGARSTMSSQISADARVARLSPTGMDPMRSRDFGIGGG